MKLLTLTTDFGTKDWFVGTMKGVILSLCPGAAIVDLTHEIPAGDVRAGAFALAACHRYFPKGTVHVAVVDPGVGSSRAALAVKTSNGFFVGPDNGVLSFALRTERIETVRRLENRACFLEPVSQTFHGRDVFAPVAAHLCCGFPIRKLGPEQPEFVRLRWPEPMTRHGAFHGEIIWLDRFGNLVTNLEGKLLHGLNLLQLQFPGRAAKAIPLATHYQAVPLGRLVALVGSNGLLEISVNGGSAARQLKVVPGDRLRLCRPGIKAAAAVGRRKPWAG